MYKVILILVFILITFLPLFAQMNTARKDSLGKDKILLENIFHKNINSFQLVIPQSAQHFISESGYNSLDEFYFSQNNIGTYEKGMKQILAFGYKDLTKYDLGEIGKYLGISKNLMAIILAILSTM